MADHSEAPQSVLRNLEFGLSSNKAHFFCSTLIGAYYCIS